MSPNISTLSSLFIIAVSDLAGDEFWSNVCVVDVVATHARAIWMKSWWGHTCIMGLEMVPVTIDFLVSLAVASTCSPFVNDEVIINDQLVITLNIIAASEVTWAELT